MIYKQLADLVRRTESVSHTGKIENVIGMTIEASGVKGGIGDLCVISDGGKAEILAEIVGFKHERVLLMPYGEIKGIAVGHFVKNTRRKLSVPVGDFLKGRIVDAVGKPFDEGPDFEERTAYFSGSGYVNPLTRPPITTKKPTPKHRQREFTSRPYLTETKKDSTRRNAKISRAMI